MQVTDPTPAPAEPTPGAPEVEEREQSFEDFEREMEGKPAAPPAPAATDDPPADPPPAPEEKPAKAERPFKRILAANAQTNAELERLRAENERLRAATAQPAPAAPPAPAPDATVDQYGPKAQPMPEDFEKDGNFDSKAYMSAFGAWNRAEALREVDRRDADRGQKAQAQAEEVEIRQAAQTWQSQANELAKEDPEIGEAIAFMRRDDVACFIPEKIQVKLLRVNPLVSVAIASRQDFLDVMQSGNEADALHLIGRIEGVLDMATRRAGAAPAPAAVETPEPPRAPNGQFTPPPVRAPVPKPAPRGPVDLGGGGSASVNPIDMDFATYEKHMDAKRRGR